MHIGLAPTYMYLSDCVSTVSAASGKYRLRSTASAVYVLRRTRTKYGERGFIYSGPVQPPRTLFHPTFTILLTPVHSENDSRVYFLIVLITDYCWRSCWTCHIAAPYKSRVDWLIETGALVAGTASDFSVTLCSLNRASNSTHNQTMKIDIDFIGTLNK